MSFKSEEELDVLSAVFGSLVGFGLRKQFPKAGESRAIAYNDPISSIYQNERMNETGVELRFDGTYLTVIPSFEKIIYKGAQYYRDLQADSEEFTPATKRIKAAVESLSPEPQQENQSENPEQSDIRVRVYSQFVTIDNKRFCVLSLTTTEDGTEVAECECIYPSEDGNETFSVEEIKRLIASRMAY
jgi:hypothetical protein